MSGRVLECKCPEGGADEIGVQSECMLAHPGASIRIQGLWILSEQMNIGMISFRFALNGPSLQAKSQGRSTTR